MGIEIGQSLALRSTALSHQSCDSLRYLIRSDFEIFLIGDGIDDECAAGTLLGPCLQVFLLLPRPLQRRVSRHSKGLERGGGLQLEIALLAGNERFGHLDWITFDDQVD